MCNGPLRSRLSIGQAQHAFDHKSLRNCRQEKPPSHILLYDMTLDRQGKHAGRGVTKLGRTRCDCRGTQTLVVSYRQNSLKVAGGQTATKRWARTGKGRESHWTLVLLE